MRRKWLVLLVLQVLAPFVAQAQFNYAPSGDGVGITITGYTDSGGSLTIPTNFNGLTVTGIGNSAFTGSGLTSVTIPGTVTNIGDYAFSSNNLAGAYFEGNAPSGDSTVFAGDSNVVVYYLVESLDWGTTWNGFPAAVWSEDLVLNGGFETGDFTDWTLVGTTIYDDVIWNAVVSSAFTAGGFTYVHSGVYGAELGGNTGPDLAEVGPLAMVSQTLATVAGQRYVLSFWLENSASTPPVIFKVNWSLYGGITNNIYSLTNPPVFNWTNFNFVVTAEGDSTALQFEGENAQYYVGLDDVSVVPLRPPIIDGMSFSGPNLQIEGGNGFSGVAYCALASTNLALPLSQWTPIVTNVLTASGDFTIAVTNAVSSGASQWFYILRIE